MRAHVCGLLAYLILYIYIYIYYITYIYIIYIMTFSKRSLGTLALDALSFITSTSFIKYV